MKQSNPIPHQVSWLPAHPVYGSVSMTRYWKLLESATLPNDPFTCNSILTASATDSQGGGRIKKLLTRKLFYPATVRTRARGEIVHILDHSWADLLPYAPQKAFKIVTVHDLIPLRFPGELTAAQEQRFRGWVFHLKQADAIIADSTYTKQEIQELLGIDDRKIHVVFLGVELPHDSENTNRFTLGTDDVQPFRIGSIGSTLERKNLAILPTALAHLKTMIRRKVILVRVGSPLPHSLGASIRKELGDGGLIEHGYLPDEAIAAYYAALDVVVVPSLYEGFGLPVIEGMAARVPVVASRCTSLPEVGGDLAFYFDPHSPEELAAVLAGIATDGVPPQRIEAGYERAKSLSWRKCLEGVYQVYETALNHRLSRSAGSTNSFP
jgi:glycosyltransferase involved in cell wall biosynthesis